MMRRGFKAWCEKTTGEYRDTLGLTLDDALEPRRLADLLEIEIWRPEDVPDLSGDSLAQLTKRDSESWSAVTVQHGDARLIILNSAHVLTRQRNSLAHEISHMILDHGLGRIDVSPDGYLLLNSFEKEQEEEADWLAGTLLVPREGLQIVYRTTRDPQSLANHFGVSVTLLQWRLRMTGVAVQSRRARTYWR